MFYRERRRRWWLGQGLLARASRLQFQLWVGVQDGKGIGSQDVGLYSWLGGLTATGPVTWALDLVLSYHCDCHLVGGDGDKECRLLGCISGCPAASQHDTEQIASASTQL